MADLAVINRERALYAMHAGLVVQRVDVDWKPTYFYHKDTGFLQIEVANKKAEDAMSGLPMGSYNIIRRVW
jgi:hypothetical protein